MSADTRPTYTALRRALQAHGAGAGALAGLAELAAVLHGRHGPAAAARWLRHAHPGLGGRTPLEVWLAGRADRVIDAARAETLGET